MKLSIIGCGRWGSFLAWYLSEKKGYSVLMQGRAGSASLTELATTHKNEYVTLNENVTFTDLKESAVPTAGEDCQMQIKMKNVVYSFNESALSKELIQLHDKSNAIIIKE